MLGEAAILHSSTVTRAGLRTELVEAYLAEAPVENKRQE
jgi:hypothetical protein